MRDAKAIKEAIADYVNLSESTFLQKYGLETMKEVVGFIKGLRWVLELN